MPAPTAALRRLHLTLAAAGLAFAAVTLWALESGGVAILKTSGPNASSRTTRVWFVEQSGAIWLEAATPERPWLLDLSRSNRVILVIGGQARAYRAEPVHDAEAHSQIRTLMRSKYAVRDWSVGLLQDTSRSVAVRLETATGVVNPLGARDHGTAGD